MLVGVPGGLSLFHLPPHARVLTLMSTLWTSCQAMSLQPWLRAFTGMLASAYQLRFTTWAYVPEGDACCTRVVVTMPTAFPAAPP